MTTQSSGPAAADGFIALDFGAGGSRIAHGRGDATQHVTDLSGDAHIPSVLAMSADGGYLAGTPARDRQALFPEQTVPSLKSLITMLPADVESMGSFFPLKVSEGAKSLLQLELGGRSRSSVELVAYYLNYLRRGAEISLERSIRSVVITVPVSFSSFDRTSLNLAAKLAGFRRVRFIEDTTAAALHWAAHGGRGRVAICCWGAEYLSMAILEIGEGLVRVRSMGGRRRIGGDMIDQALASELLAKAREKGVALDNEAHIARHLLVAAEIAKRDLAKRGKADMQLSLGGGEAIRHTFTAEDLGRWITPHVNRARDLAKQVLTEADLKPNDLDSLIVTGGMTHLAGVQSCLEESFGRSPLEGIDAEYAVVDGALIRARLLDRDRSDPLVLDVIPDGHGLRGRDGGITAFLPQGVVLPASVRESFSTVLDRQTQMGVPLYGQVGKDWQELATIEISKIPPLDAGKAQIEVAFLVDENGLLSVSATEMTKSKKLQVEVHPVRGPRASAVATAIEAIPVPPEEESAEELIREELRHRGRFWLQSLRELVKRRSTLMTRDEKQLADKKAQELAEVLETGADLVETRLCLQEMEEIVRPLMQRDIDASLQTLLR